MAQKQTAFVVVQQSWYDGALKALIGGHSNSSADHHLITGLLEDASDHRGLWLAGATSERWFNQDGTPVIMKVMIPWQFVLVLGVADEGTTMPAGFKGATVLSGGDATASN
jgi:hypothetical protein